MGRNNEMHVLREILYRGKMLLCAIWYLILLIFDLLLIPIFFFLPDKITENFNDNATNAALKILLFIWCVIKCCFFITFGLVLIPLTPVLIIYARLCGTLWAWVVSGGNPTLETKKRVYAVLAMFGFCLMIIFGILGLAIGCISGEFLAPIVGGVAGFLLWFYATRDCFDLHDKAENELNFANRPYYFVDSCSSQKILFTVKSSAPPPECSIDSDPTAPPLSSSESNCCRNDSPSRPAT